MSVPRVMLAALCVCLLGGCGGGDGPTTYQLSGKVTYNGQPVPVGTVTLSPNVAQGNSGPGAAAGIKDGSFSTEPGKGHVGGPYLIQVTGFDGVPVPGGEGGMDPMGKELFPPYEMSVDLPKENHEIEIAVPAGGGGTGPRTPTGP